MESSIQRIGARGGTSGTGEELSGSGRSEAKSTVREWREEAQAHSRGNGKAQAEPSPREEECTSPGVTRLVHTIECEVIPRLVLSWRMRATASGLAAERVVAPPGTIEVAELSRLVLARDLEQAPAFVETLRRRGVSTESVYLHLLGPTARHLGRMWETDRTTFAEVTVGLGRLQQIVHRLSHSFLTEGGKLPHGRRALLVPTPGEQHTFGVSLVSEFFCRAGWDVVSLVPSMISELADIVRTNWFDVVGLSLSSEQRADITASAVRALRRGSSNHALGIMVGGPALCARPELVRFVGADATAFDALQAVRQAEHMLDLLAIKR